MNRVILDASALLAMLNSEIDELEGRLEDLNVTAAALKTKQQEMPAQPQAAAAQNFDPGQRVLCPCCHTLNVPRAVQERN